jgi:hypothetical protein
MRDRVPFDHVAKESGVHVATQELEPITRIDALCFGKAAARQIGVQCLVYRSLSLCPPMLAMFTDYAMFMKT